MKRRIKRGTTARIYYGTSKTPLFWTVKVSDAKQNVTISGSLADAMQGRPGETIGCHLSNCALRNHDTFPHPVFFAAFTKRAALVVDKIVNGAPYHAVRYHHNYSHLVDLNDQDKNKQYIKKHPELAERSFTLIKPHKSKSRPNQVVNSRPRGVPSGDKSHRVPYGALRRARAAGLITADIANAVK